MAEGTLAHRPREQSGGARRLVSVFTGMERLPAASLTAPPRSRVVSRCGLPFSGLVSVKRSSGGKKVTACGCKFFFYLFFDFKKGDRGGGRVSESFV